MSSLATYIDTNAGPLFAAFDNPDRSDSTGVPVLVCSPWGWAEMASYRSRRDWAASLADAGHPTLRFDLPGTGNSWGSQTDPGLCAAWIEAIGEAAAWLRARCGDAPRLAGLGLGIGGLLLLEAIEAGAAIDEAALWATPASGGAFVRETRAFSRMQRWSGAEEGGSPLPPGSIEAVGFVLAAETSEELKAHDATAFAASPPLRRALLLGRDEAAPSEPLTERLREAGVEVTVDEGLGWGLLTANPEQSRPPAAVMRSVSTWLAAGAPGDARRAVTPLSATPEPTQLTWGGSAVRETVLDIPTRAGRGFGVVCEPGGGQPSGPCGVFLNAAADRHIGPNRMWVKAARDLAAAGARTVRLDLEGIGESDGDSGRFVDEGEFFEPDIGRQLTAILDRLEEIGFGREFVVFGVSSGGYWGFRLALTDPRVRGSVILNPSVFVWRPTLVLERWGHGFGMVFRGDLWKRLARGEFSARKLASMGRLLLRRARETVARLLGRLGSGPDPEPEEAAVESELAADFDQLSASGTELSIGFTDDELSQKELGAVLDQLDRWPGIRLTRLPGVSHSLAPTSAQEVALGLVREGYARLSGDD